MPSHRVHRPPFIHANVRDIGLSPDTKGAPLEVGLAGTGKEHWVGSDKGEEREGCEDLHGREHCECKVGEAGVSLAEFEDRMISREVVDLLLYW